MNTITLPVSPETLPAAAPHTSATYEAPAIERVITPDDMAREVFYAGNITER